MWRNRASLAVWTGSAGHQQVAEGFPRWHIGEMLLNTKKRVPAFGYFPETEVMVTVYPNGALALVGQGGQETQFVATVNLAPYGSRPLDVHEVWMKGWGENEGVPEALARAGVITLTGETMPAGHAIAQLAHLSPDIVMLCEEELERADDEPER